MGNSMEIWWVDETASTRAEKTALLAADEKDGSRAAQKASMWVCLLAAH